MINNNKVLMIGNGINLLPKVYSWENLMDDLIEFVGGEDFIQKGTKPFPLLYEEIYLSALRDNKLNSENDLKEKIKELLLKVTFNDYHKEVFNLGIYNILTTNYDYNLENAINLKRENGKPLFKTSERKYSLLRGKKYYKKNNSFRLWHLHGELDDLRTILVGYEQYSGYLQNIRDYFFSGKKYKNESFNRLSSRLEPPNNKKKFKHNFPWIDYFFTSDIYILGFSLEFTEIHFWWILSYRLKLINETEKPQIVNNKIHYVYREIQEEERTNEEYKKIISKSGKRKFIMDEYKKINTESKLQLLENYNVKLQAIKAKDWESFYKKAFDFIRNN